MKRSNKTSNGRNSRSRKSASAKRFSEDQAGGLFTLFPDYRKGEFCRRSKEKRKSIVSQLRETYRRKGIVLYLGSGVSCSVGLPSWPELVRRLTLILMHRRTYKVVSSTGGEEWWTYYIKALSQVTKTFQHLDKTEKPILMVARAVKDDLGGNLLYYIGAQLYARLFDSHAKGTERWKRLRDRGSSAITLPSSPLVDSVVALARSERDVEGVKAIVNYNFDDLVDARLRRENVRCTTVRTGQDKIGDGSLPCFHVHGVIPIDSFLRRKPLTKRVTGNLVFSEDEYHQEYADAYRWSNMTQVGFMARYTGLFVGLSMEDPNLRRLIDVAHRQYPEMSSYAILPRKKPLSSCGDSRRVILQNLIEEVESNSFERIGVHVVWVDSYDEVPKVIQQICCP
jgi:hypothetical protein